MNVFVSPDLYYIKEELKNRGYSIVDDGSIPCDAIICNLKNCDLNSFNIQTSIKREGTLIIDCGSKTINDIDYILNNRVYSPLF